ncbi:phosphoglycerate mutase-like protein, partial [Teratosphaeria nubilosa]
AYADSIYTVWSSVIFSRTGERTPDALSTNNLPTTLTSLGAHEQYASGSAFRKRYITSSGDSTGGSSAPIYGLNTDAINSAELYVMAADLQYAVASAQAFLQGFYPPSALNTSAAPTLDPTSMLANGTYLEDPLSGYQYPYVHVAGAYDAQFPYVAGNEECPALAQSILEAQKEPHFKATNASSYSVYEAVGPVLLDNVLSSSQWSYARAYAIYDYVNYQNTHDISVNALLDEPQYIDPASNDSYLSQLRWLAHKQQRAYLTNLTRTNTYTGNDKVAANITGSISTISGNMLLAKMLAQLEGAIFSQGTQFKLSLLFGEFPPMLSLFALMSLPHINPNFRGIPDFASVIVFELYTWTSNTTNSSSTLPFPAEEDFWVRFYFRNGTGDSVDASADDAGSTLQSYPLFGNGPDQTDMLWTTFREEMGKFIVSDVADWCRACGSGSIFCAAFNTTLAAKYSGSAAAKVKAELGAVVGGVIGAVVALGVAGLILAASMVCGGLRFHRVERRRKSELGGFKGNAKLASDRDLTLKNGATVGVTVEREVGHERAGSWELRAKEVG